MGENGNSSSNLSDEDDLFDDNLNGHGEGNNRQLNGVYLRDQGYVSPFDIDTHNSLSSGQTSLRPTPSFINMATAYTHPQNTNSSYSTMVDEDAYQEKGEVNGMPSTPRKAARFSNAPEYPPIAYSPHRPVNFDEKGIYKMETVDSYDFENASVPLRPYSQVMEFTGDDYNLNPLEDPDTESIDPFGDDESLFLDADDDLIRRGASMKHNGPLSSASVRNASTNTDAEGKSVVYDYEDENFQPRLNYTKTVKRAKLLHGNYVIDAPVPKALLDTFGKKIMDGREMSFMRYTAVTCGPSNFVHYNYNLRQALYQPVRETEILICVTMYNEDEILLARTLSGIFDNMRDLTNRSDPRWGEDSWKKVVVCIVCDGRVTLNKRAESLLTALGVYQEGYAKSKINEKPVKAHVYEYTSTVGIDAVNDRVHLCPNSTPIQFLFCLKEKNSRKINSHRWCFQSFCPLINPRIVILLDCGTRPAKSSMYSLWRAFHDSNVAGACGELRAALGPGKKLLVNPLVAAQNFEYKISNILDKPMESTFGFITVLPGAFSAYRYEALLNVDGKGPLEKYFKGEFLHASTQVDDDDDEKKLKEKNFKEAGLFTSNMYLAEDRILCFELVAKKGHNYILRYVNEATAETDVPESIDEFVLQRRRWLNGSMFAACYSVVHWTKIWKSNHSLLRKLFLQFEFYYQFVTLLVSWFSLASFFLVFRILTANLGASDMNFSIGKYLAVILLWFYVGAVVCSFVLSFGNRPRDAKKFYLVITCCFAILMAYMTFAVIFLAVHTIQLVLKDHKDDFSVSMLFTNQKFRDLIVSILSTYLLYTVAAMMYGELSFMVTSFFQYLLLSPSYINILNIYAFCNIHDITWGTKGDQQAKDLGSAKSSGDDKENIVTVVPGVPEELDDIYTNTLETLRVLPPQNVEINNFKQKNDSYYALVRTLTVLVWMLTNFILIAIVLESSGISTFTGNSSENADFSIGGNSGVFLTVILWIVAALAAFRFVGSCAYIILKVFRPLKWKFKARRTLRNA